jgi:hypothetical protein
MTSHAIDPAQNRQGTPDTQSKQRGQTTEPQNPEGAAQATKDNDLTTGHSRADDGGDDNSKGKR